MVFSSYEFLVFLILVCALYAALVGLREQLGKATLILVSLVFYAYWIPGYLLILLASNAFNFGVAQGLKALRGTRAARWLLIGGIACNLAAIGYYKYLDLFISATNWGFNTEFALQHLALPIGISFFTFQQISLLVDQYRGLVKPVGYSDYLFLICFFPHLIAGPIVRQSDLLPQVAGRTRWRLQAHQVTLGLAIFAAGLFKKTVISDQIARYSDHIFNTVASGVAPGFVDGWVGAFAYGLQIYFDFSGYSDMAVGLAYIFGFRLPINFFSPYKSASPRDFWRRWHISLSNFLREYLYIPLGGNRFGLQRTLFALMATMVLGGLWHGAALTFIVWGTLHGALLVANHLYQSSGLAMRFSVAADGVIPKPIRRCLAIAMTYIAVTAIWVYFRAPDVATANRMIAAMFGFGSDASFTPLHADVVITLLVGQAIVFLLPNTAQLFRKFGIYQHADRYMDPAAQLKPDWLWTYRLTPRWAVTSAITFLVAWFALSNLSPFIYFQF